MVCDIVARVAWMCGDKDCKAQWHQADYWAYDDGRFTLDHYSDGDHEEIERDEMPSFEAEAESWRQYAAYVASTGLDPLQAYAVKRTIRRREVWLFRIADSILGPLLIGAKRGRQPVAVADLPPHVRDYLGLKEGLRPRLTDFEAWPDLVAAQPGIRPNRWWAVEIDHERPRSPAAVKREVMALARKA